MYFQLFFYLAKMKDAGFLDPSVDMVKLAELTKNYSGAEIEVHFPNLLKNPLKSCRLNFPKTPQNP